LIFESSNNSYKIFLKRILIENLTANLKDQKVVKEPMKMKPNEDNEILGAYYMQWTIVAALYNDFRQQ
jgi:hypothetical protein